MSEQSDRDVIEAVTKETRITLGSALLAVAALFSIYFMADARLRSVESRLDALEWQMTMLTEVLEKASRNNWTQTEMHLWTKLLKIQNPDMNVEIVPALEDPEIR